MTTPIDYPTSKPATRALVLGGGGTVGRAWEKGIVAGLHTSGIDLSQADRIIGTSAGAIVGAELALGLAMNRAVPVVDPALESAPSPARAAGLQHLMAAMAHAATASNPEAEWEQVGQMALAAPTVNEATALARPTLAAVTGQVWPSSFWATAHSARTGRFQVWSSESNVPLERAVASSAALPGVWPPITIGDDRYIDGGVRSMLNADLAAGYASIVVVSCFALTVPEDANGTTATLNQALLAEIDGLRQAGSAVEVITPNEAFLELTKNGTMMLNNALVPEAYEIGKQQAHAEADRIRRIWAVQA